MKKLLTLTLTLVTLLCISNIAVAQRNSHPNLAGPTPVHNGIWWSGKQMPYKEGFMIGYKSGAERAVGHPTDITKFPSSELIDGIDSFYKDFRNRSIVIDDALPYIAEQLRGVSDETLKTELLKMRAASAPTNVE